MGCLPSTSAQELTEDTALDVLHAFLETNEIIFQDCYLGMNQCFKRSVFDFMEFSDFKNLVDPVLLTQFLGDCLWSYRSSPDLIEELASLLPLLETRNNIAYEILRILWYLCNDSLPEEVKRTGWLQRVQERPLTSGQFSEVAVYKGGYQFACHFLASAILGKISHFGGGYIQELLRVYLDTQLPDAVTAVLVYWSKFPQEFEPIIFTQTAILKMSDEQFQLYLEIVAFYPTLECPMETICSRFEAVELSIPLQLSSYLEESTRLLAFLDYFRKRADSHLQKALLFVLHAIKSISQKVETSFGILTAVLTHLDIATLPQNVVLDCEKQLQELFDIQFTHCQVDLPFSDAYLKQTTRTSQNSTEIAKKVRELVFYATIDTVDQGKRLDRLADYLKLIFEDWSNFDNFYALTDKTTVLMTRCIELFPQIIDPLLKSATSAMETLHRKEAIASVEDEPTIASTIKSVEKLIQKMSNQSAPEITAAPALMTMIERYTKCILQTDRTQPDLADLKAIMRDCEMQTNGLNHLLLSQVDYNSDTQFTTIVYCVVKRHAERLRKGIAKHWQEPGYRQKWQNHAFLIRNSPDLLFFNSFFRVTKTCFCAERFSHSSYALSRRRNR